MIADDRVRIRHMIEAAEEAISFCRGFDEGTFAQDRRTVRAVTQCIEIIGEAARMVGEDTREQIPDVPWRAIVGMRHRLAHVYFDIDESLVWRVVARDLRPLIDNLTEWEKRHKT